MGGCARPRAGERPCTVPGLTLGLRSPSARDRVQASDPAPHPGTTGNFAPASARDRVLGGVTAPYGRNILLAEVPCQSPRAGERPCTILRLLTFEHDLCARARVPARDPAPSRDRVLGGVTTHLSFRPYGKVGTVPEPACWGETLHRNLMMSPYGLLRCQSPRAERDR